MSSKLHMLETCKMLESEATEITVRNIKRLLRGSLSITISKVTRMKS